MPQTLWLVVGGGITEVADADILRVLGLRDARIATDEEVAAHRDAQHRVETAAVATAAVATSAPPQAASAPAQDATGATLDGTDKTLYVDGAPVAKSES